MKFSISPQIFQNYPNLFIGCIVLKNTDNNGTNNEIAQLLTTEQENLKQKLGTTNLAEHPHVAPWREAYRKFGSNFRCSTEALVRLTLKGKQLRSINKFVDLYNYISLKYILTVGGEDLDKIEGDLRLDYATGNENFIPLGQTENNPPTAGEVIYKDNSGVICRRWNWREGDRTKLTEQTKNAIFVIESIPPINIDLVKSATKELGQLLEKYCGGSPHVAYLDKDDPTVEFD